MTRGQRYVVSYSPPKYSSMKLRRLDASAPANYDKHKPHVQYTLYTSTSQLALLAYWMSCAFDVSSSGGYTPGHFTLGCFMPRMPLDSCEHSIGMVDWLTEQGLTSPSAQYRLYGRWKGIGMDNKHCTIEASSPQEWNIFSTVKRPAEQCPLQRLGRRWNVHKS